MNTKQIKDEMLKLRVQLISYINDPWKQREIRYELKKLRDQLDVLWDREPNLDNT